MNKFERNINSGSQTLGDRGSLIASQAKRAQEDLIRALESKIDDKKMEVLKMCDIAPDQTTSLRPSGQAADDPKGWVNDLHKLKKEIKMADIELVIAKETLAEWFVDAVTDTKQ